MEVDVSEDSKTVLLDGKPLDFAEASTLGSDLTAATHVVGDANYREEFVDDDDVWYPVPAPWTWWSTVKTVFWVSAFIGAFVLFIVSCIARNKVDAQQKLENAALVVRCVNVCGDHPVVVEWQEIGSDVPVLHQGKCTCDITKELR